MNTGYCCQLTVLHACAHSRYHSCVQKLVYLSLGSNLGNRVANLETAIERLRELGSITAISSFYETEPVDYVQQPWFLNCAVALRTDAMPRQLLTRTLAVEQAMGRRRGVPKGPRVIDIDILLFGTSMIDTAILTIPHPALHERRFVLEPLAEIAPEARHPVFKKTIRELFAALPHDGAKVRRIRKTPAEEQPQ
ncbi:MAG TPA: 2-amino-4-hydroxy-6-hydroxymethyldihydropteridine diphosphokinase [Clostridia bacterium]|nr:2-amino-4-hydroxy-6-hydroxymethyldihydropteridine diphosphokinase [Clostridia bacterium]